MIEGLAGQQVTLIAVPRFKETGLVVLVDSETLEVEYLQIELGEQKDA